jgi:hypothetical protein
MATSSTPNLPSSSPSPETKTPDVKSATPDIILFDDESTPIEIMTDLIFENIGGQELINILRSDIINGQNVIYQPIKNLTNLYFQYNPQNILALQDTDSNYFKKFPINFSSKVPVCGTGPECSIVYLEPGTGNLIINVVNVARDEQVEVSIISDGEVLDDTIYGV